MSGPVPAPLDHRQMEIERLRDALRDIEVGADMMLQPSVAAIMPRSLLRYAEEVRKVARAGLSQ